MAKKTKKMTGEELKSIRINKLGMTQTELALALWMSEKAGHRSILAYEKEERTIRPTIQLAIAYLLKYGPLPKRLK